MKHTLLATITSLSLLSGYANGQDAGKKSASASEEAIRMLPTGSVLRKVLLPRYDSQWQLSSTLRAEKITITSEDTIATEQLTMQLYDGAQREELVRLHLQLADYRKSSGFLTSQTPVELLSSSFTLNGSGLRFHTPTKRGFIYGPILSFLRSSPTTTMNPSRAATLVALSLGTLLANAPDPLSASEQEQLQTPLAQPPEQIVTQARAAQQQTEAQLANSSQQLTAFLTEAAIASTILQNEGVPEPKPLEIKANPNDTKIESDGGVYFDAEKGVLVYLKNVRVHSPQFILTGANELHVFLAKKANAATNDKKPTTDKSAAPAGLDQSFGDVEKIVAQGVLQIQQIATQPEQVAIQASATRLTYFQKSSEMILSGGYPWVKQGDKYLRAKEPNLYLRIQKDGSFRTEGNWEMGGRIAQPTTR